ncbi:hypothetical protein CBR_g31212 [Chara braunii]|uniref:Integrase catalytic domain-containing protein n=1 Tax=Chara braunii TaxID=69332 RepID=A0A388JXR6_CHABU|nr:hypothetical protein CBR_g31212 [Chara braunii]|eukprot:GBG62575.1 hypothetical protein CBR_g31212 [Chara braunii]
MPIPQEPGLSIAMDVTGPFPRDRLGHDGILTVVDQLSKYARFLPCKYYSTAPELARLLHTGWIYGHGLPEDIVRDRDTRFMSAFWTALMQEFGTKMKPSSARHPQTDGQTERAHQTAQMMLRTLIRPDQKDWVDRLPDIEFAYNTSVPLALPLSSGSTGNCWLKPTRICKRLRMQQQANRHREPRPIRAGDLVWVSAKEFALKQEVSRKLLPKWFGPWPVTSAAGDEPDGPSFVINIPPHLTVHPVFHASKLATYTPTKSDDFPGRRSQDPPMDGHQEVDHVITDRKYGSKPRQYKVTFKACDRDHTRWISGADLKASAPLIYAHYEKQRLAQEASQPAPPTRTVVPPSDRQLRPCRSLKCSPSYGAQSSRSQGYNLGTVKEQAVQQFIKEPNTIRSWLRTLEQTAIRTRKGAQTDNKRTLEDVGDKGNQEGLKKRKATEAGGREGASTPPTEIEEEGKATDARGTDSEQGGEGSSVEGGSSTTGSEEGSTQSLQWLREYVDKVKREREHAFDIRAACLKHTERSQTSGKKGLLGGVGISNNQFDAFRKVKAEEPSEYTVFRYAEKKRAREQGPKDKDRTVPESKDEFQDLRPRKWKSGKNQKKKNPDTMQADSPEDSEHTLLEKEAAVVLAQTDELKKLNEEYASEFITISHIARDQAPLVVETAQSSRLTLMNIRPLIAARYMEKIEEWQIATDVSFQIPCFEEGQNVADILREKLVKSGILEWDGDLDPVAYPADWDKFYRSEGSDDDLQGWQSDMEKEDAQGSELDKSNEEREGFSQTEYQGTKLGKGIGRTAEREGSGDDPMGEDTWGGVPSQATSPRTTVMPNHGIQPKWRRSKDWRMRGGVRKTGETKGLLLGVGTLTVWGMS